MLDRLSDRLAVHGEAERTKKLLRSMQRKDQGLLLLPLIVIVLLSIGLILSDSNIWNSMLSFREGPSDELAFLTLNLVLYIVFRHRQVRRIYAKLMRERIRAETLTRRLDELRSILEVTSSVRSSVNLDATLEVIAENARGCLEGDFATLYLRCATERELDPKAVASGSDPDRVPDRVPLGEGIAGTVGDERRPLILSDPAEIAARSDRRERLDGMGAVLSVPLLHGRICAGTLTVAKSSAGKACFSLADLQLLMIFADHAAHVVDSVRRKQEIERSASELARTRDGLHRARRYLETSGRGRSHDGLVSKLGHDMANPLTSILGYSQLLQKLPLDEKPREYATHIFGETRRCQEIVEDFVSSIQGSNAESRPCEINRILELALEQRSGAMSARDIRVIRSLSDSLPPVPGNPLLIQEAFSHLIRNAEQALDEVDGRKIFRVSTALSGHQIRVCIEDTGPGVPKEHAHHIFEPFFSTRDRGTSNGLGLTIASKILYEHGATIRHEANETGGTRFTVEFTVQEAASELHPDDLARRSLPRHVERAEVSGGAPTSLDNVDPRLLQSERFPGPP